jgi:hypothetical protein
MRLFEGFDEIAEIEKSSAVLRVDDSNVEALLEKLDL